MSLTTIGSSGEAAVRGSVAEALRGRRADVGGRVFEAALLAALLLCLLLLGTLIWSVVVDGVGVYTERGWEFLDSGLSRRPARAGISQGLIGSFWIAVSVVAVAFPLGIGAAVYLEEYAPRNRLTSFIELNIRNLAGVPSVVYGLLGLAIFVKAMSGFVGAGGVERRTLAAAGATLAVLVLPIVIITTAEALRAVPTSLREGAYGVGATRWEVIRSVVLPYAAPGIFTGALLSIARAVGEAAPLIVVGAVTGFSSRGVGLSLGNLLDPTALGERFTAMPAVVTAWSKLPQDEFKVDNTAAAIMGMLVFVLLINSIAIVLRNRFERKRSL
ncbi:MAG TPA: phosphate ABC transporter permease PstA [Acidimicrobiales bacterium]